MPGQGTRPRQVGIIGGGYAGLACAVELARRDVRVAVFEASRVLGGRARIVHTDDFHVDNGQHLLLGAYAETLRLMRTVGVRPGIFDTRPLDLHYPGEFRLRAAALPAPLHLAVGLLRAEGMSWSERFACLRFLRHLKKQRFRLPVNMTVDELLERADQPERLRRLLWAPLCVAALNTPSAQASARVFATVLRDSLAAGASASEMLLPKVDLSELFPVPAARWLARHGGHVYVTEPISAIERTRDGFALKGDPTPKRRFDQVVIATAPYHAGDLLSGFPALAPVEAQLAALTYEPILTTYLQYDAPVRLAGPMVGTLDGPAEWFFDRAQFGGPDGLIAGVVSASGPHLTVPRQEIELAMHNQLEGLLGRQLPRPEAILTIVEKRATFACGPNLSRPATRTGEPGLWLAGDYVDGPYPATIEGAVRSGVACARAILSAR
ncbi:FAD-dependent oxidoreductase [Nitrogeniibacter mangrovi]|uniref:FAD-dependent oxidoreductase n=1 Tax=Nitrogeniibacter mangrovi TaxID=2016596 RepID=A0A6C1B470_9RHOO|nr:hydroxysqualene dehydroxylase HpnE [Nitrogeniibacter mangrovi]QID17799.1 FAD-dependent oxidoreductase [Nitrogeniibacter mangrovi]